jgi:hypothetical protein
MPCKTVMPSPKRKDVYHPFPDFPSWDLGGLSLEAGILASERPGGKARNRRVEIVVQAGGTEVRRLPDARE